MPIPKVVGIPLLENRETTKARQLWLLYQGGSGLETVLRLMRSPQGFALLFAGHGMNMANLSLTLMDRCDPGAMRAHRCAIASAATILYAQNPVED